MRNRVPLALAAVVLLSAITAAPPERAEGCCMVPANFPGGVGQSAQKGILIHREGVEDLILQIAYEIEPGEGGELPEKLTWLIALPSEPMEEDGYALADARVFDELHNLTQFELVDQIREVPRSIDRGNGNELDSEQALNGVELGRRVEIGPYDIQPVRGVGENAFEGLNAWLEARGFPTETEEHMAWFTENGFTFLAIEVTPGEGEETIGAGQALPPLRVRFETEYPYYPLKYSSQQGDFELALYVLTDRQIDLGHSAGVLDAIGWVNRPGTPAMTMRGVTYSVWKEPQMLSVRDLFNGRHIWQGQSYLRDVSGEVIEARERWHFACFNSRPNPADRPITAWTGDCYFTLVGQQPAPLATGGELASR